MSSINLRKAVAWTLVTAVVAAGTAVGMRAGGQFSEDRGAQGVEAQGGRMSAGSAGSGEAGRGVHGGRAADGGVAPAPGGPEDKGGMGEGEGGKPTVELSNNLSYPIMELASGGAAGTIGPAMMNVPGGALGVNYSYGCLEDDPAAEYPNRSCVSEDGQTFYAATSSFCQTLCAGKQIQPIYWQKTVGQSWKSEVVPSAVGTETAAYVDWGDALESRTSAITSVVRVETMPFYYSGSESETMKGFEMWHVYGQGKSEMWGLRATDATSSHSAYMYETPYAIIHTGEALLNIAKLDDGVNVACPPSGPSSPYDGIGENEALPRWNGSSWNGALFTAEQPFTAELNIGGKYVYGYNWMLQTFPTPGVSKAGWWRLTFRASDVHFDSDTVIGPAPAYGATPTTSAVSVTAVAGEDESDGSGPLYLAVVRGDYDLTFIDVCISESKGGGEGSRRPESPGE